VFTQCPACQTIFKLSAETLRAAAGEVRCGRCGEEFNALGSLAEEPQAFAGAAQQQASREPVAAAAAPRADDETPGVATPGVAAQAEPAAALHSTPGPMTSEAVPPFAPASETPGVATPAAAESVPPAESPAAFETSTSSESEAPFEIEAPASQALSESQTASEFHATSEATTESAADFEQASHPGGESLTIADDPSLEFTLPPGELDRIFVEARPYHFAPRRGPLALSGLEELEPADTHAAAGAAPGVAMSGVGTAGDTPARTTAAGAAPIGASAGATAMVKVLATDTATPRGAALVTAASLQTRAAAPDEGIVSAPFAYLDTDAATGDERAMSWAAEDAAQASDTVGAAASARGVATPGIATQAASMSDVATPGVATSDTVAADWPEATARTRANWMEQILPTRDIEDLAPPRERHRGRWIAAVAALALLLATQLVHRYRDTLAQTPGVGGAVRALYALVGHPIAPRLNLAAFEIRPWGVTGDTTADGTLHVRASLINNGAEPQPYPLLRLKLEDRFGTRIGARDFQPAEYLHRTPQHALSPGERADLLIDILDPGKAAEGFELDVCEPRSNARVLCANDAPAGHRAP